MPRSDKFKFRIISVLFIALGVFLVFGGQMPGVVGAGGHELEGAERLMGVIPIGIGVLFWLGSTPAKK